jgi:hypothetical protein
MVLVSTLAASAAIAQTGPSTRVQYRKPATLRYLDQRIDQVTFEDAPLDQVIDYIGSLTPMQIRPRWQVLEDAGIERDKPITMDVKNLRLSQVLWIIMEEAGGPDLKLAYRATGDLLTLSTEMDLGQEMHLRVYDVSDLLVRAPRFTNCPHLDLAGQSGSMGMGGMGGGGGQNIFGGSQSGTNRDDEDDRGGRGERDEDIDELIQLIQLTVEPDSWVENGGLGTISGFRNQLVVYNNLLVHQRLGGYIEEME